ncbi:MAG: hypothetical protein M1495_02205 [Bacteroidetes bacterium]|nr:hypothetical protein [Bacteroidota bacterium]
MIWIITFHFKCYTCRLLNERDLLNYQNASADFPSFGGTLNRPFFLQEKSIFYFSLEGIK